MIYMAVGFSAIHSKATLIRTKTFGVEYTEEVSLWLPVFTTGFGTRLYLTDHLGLRPEVRLSIGEETLFRVSIALFADTK